jgi:hypothetical protein
MSYFTCNEGKVTGHFCAPSAWVLWLWQEKKYLLAHSRRVLSKVFATQAYVDQQHLLEEKKRLPFRGATAQDHLWICLSWWIQSHFDKGFKGRMREPGEVFDGTLIQSFEVTVTPDKTQMDG